MAPFEYKSRKADLFNFTNLYTDLEVEVRIQRFLIRTLDEFLVNLCNLNPYKIFKKKGTSALKITDFKRIRSISQFMNKNLFFLSL